MSACAALEGALAGSDSATREYELEVSLAVVELKEALSVTDRNRGKLDDVVAALDQAAADRTQAASD